MFTEVLPAAGSVFLPEDGSFTGTELPPAATAQQYQKHEIQADKAEEDL